MIARLSMCVFIHTIGLLVKSFSFTREQGRIREQEAPDNDRLDLTPNGVRPFRRSS